MNNFWNPNDYRKVCNIAVFVTGLGGVLSIIELLTDNSDKIFISGIALLIVLAIFKSKFH